MTSLSKKIVCTLSQSRPLCVVLAVSALTTSMMAQATFFEDGEMKDTFSGGLWQRAGSVIYGGGTTGAEFTTSGNGGGNPGAFFLAGIGGAFTNGGRTSTYSGPELSVNDLADLGTFDFAFDLKVISSSTVAPSFSVKPVLFHNDNSFLDPLIYTGSARLFTGSDWTTESWTDLTVNDFALYDSFYANPVEPAAGRTGIFYVGFLADVRSTNGNQFINWGVDNVTIRASVIPEPATASSLLAIAGLAWAFGKRRRQG